MRRAYVFSIVLLTMFLSGPTGAASRGGRRPAARPAHAAAHHAHPARSVSHRPAEKSRRTIHVIRPRVVYAGRVRDYPASCYTGDGGSWPAVDDTPTVVCPPPATDPLVQRNAARDAMDQVQARLTADMESTSQWNDMTATVAQALSDLETAQQRIEASLSDRPDYQAAVAQKQAAEELADQMQSSADYSPAEMMPIAQRDLAAGKLITQLQTQALAADPQWLAARARLQSTAAGRVAMQNQLHADLLNDPSWQAAREQLG